MPVTNTYNSFSHWLTKQLVRDKLNSPLGYIMLLTLSAAMAYVITAVGLKIGALILVGLIAIPSILFAIFNFNFGIKVALIASILIGILSKYKELPFGITLDALLFVMFFGLLIKQARNRNLSFANSPISILILIWVGLNILQVLNPSAESRLAWVFTVRSMAGLILLYFIACYAFDNLAKIFNIVKFIIAIAFISALYGLKQEFIGFSAAETTWLYADEERLQLILQWSRLRIFSFFSDPTNFGIFMAYMGTFCFVLATGPFQIWKRLALAFVGVCMFLAMAYAGSRTPFVLVPFGFLIFVLLTLKRNILIVSAIVGVMAFGVIMKSSSNAVIYRIQSAFDPRKSDDTMDVRNKNRKFIQPYVWTHPVGYGLGSTGVWAQRFTPNSFLAQFAHDSGFVRVAVELGWIGLIVICLFMFTIIRTSIYYYLRVKNQKIKVLYLGFTVILFQLTLANYPQEAITILPTSIIFYIILAAIVKMKDYDVVMLQAQAENELDVAYTEVEELGTETVT